MPRIKTELAQGVEPEEGKVYTITGVEERTTAVQGFKGLRVLLEPDKRKEGDDDQYATMLWSREEAGVKSKLGAFISGFLDFLQDEDMAFETDNWKNHKVRIVSWQPRKREITVLE